MNSVSVHEEYADEAGSHEPSRGSSPIGHLFIVPLIFLVAFAVPVLIALGIGGAFSGLNSAFEGESQHSEQLDKLFPQALSVTSQGSYVRVEHSEGQLPVAGKDFALLTFFSLKKLPSPGERLIVFSKYEGTPQPRDGYALALMNEAGAYRPMVFWGSREQGGRWYNFPEIELEPKRWMLFSLSFQRDRFLGLHYALIGEEGGESSELKLLGGYDVSDVAMPSARVPLVAGAVVERVFRGLLGPLAVISEEHLADRLSSDLTLLAEHPHQLEGRFSSDALQLWIPGYGDDLSAAVQVFKKGAKAGELSRETKHKGSR